MLQIIGFLFSAYFLSMEAEHFFMMLNYNILENTGKEGTMRCLTEVSLVILAIKLSVN